MSTVVVVSPTATTTTQEREPARTITFRRSADQPYGRKTETVIFDDCPTGLGIKIIGGTGEEEEGDFGIFIKRILFGGLADDGHLQEGDQILEVNGENLEAVTNEEAVAALRRAAASNYIKLIVTRDEQARAAFEEVLEVGAVSCGSSSTADQSSIPSHTSPVQGKSSWSSSGEHLSPGTQLSEAQVPHSSSTGRLAISALTPKTPIRGFNATLGESSRGSDVEYTGINHSLPTTPRNTRFLELSKTSTPYTVGVHRTVTDVPHVGDEPSPISLLDSDLLGLPQSLSDVSPELNPSQGHGHLNLPQMPSERKFSLGPQDKLKVEKLEVALRYLGLDPTPAQQAELRHCINIDNTGFVTYGEFVHIARQIFKNELEDRNFGLSHNFMGGRPDFLHSSQAPAPSKTSNAPLLVQERDQLREEVHRLKLALREKDQTCRSTEEELLRVRQEAQSAMQESRSLHSKLHLAEQAQRAAHNMEHDYEEVVRLLEVEVSELKAREGKTLNHPAVQKRLAVLSCQLRKAELSKKTYEVATEKLLQFTEAVHDVLTGHGEGIGLRPVTTQAEPMRGNQAPNYLGKHKRHTTQSIANEAREVVKAVKSLIEVEPLPFGWDEAYTEDGLKYFINHVTQVTSWLHPLSNVEHTSRPSSAQGRQPPPMPPAQHLEIP